MTDARQENQASIDEFCDTLWLEDGLAKNSLDAYRRDVTMFAVWLLADRCRSWPEDEIGPATATLSEDLVGGAS
jgi:site-specific recombinase XerD